MRAFHDAIPMGNRPAVTDITDDVRRFCAGRGEGLVSVFVPDATARMAIVETEAGSDDNPVRALDTLLPRDKLWGDQDGPGDFANDVMSAHVNVGATFTVLDGRLGLATRQSIVLIDTKVDNPDRRVLLSFSPGLDDDDL